MAFRKVLCVLLLISVSALASFFDRLLEENRDFGDEYIRNDDREPNVRDDVRDEARELVQEFRNLRERRVLECNKLGEGCRGIVPCCGTLQCYWKDGYSLKTAGSCVDCIKLGQLCQRDASCCSGLVCQKSRSFHTDGICDNPRPAGGSCHEDDQCASHNCNISKLEQLTFKERTCL